DPETLELVENWFECLDIPLCEGDNAITIRVTDEAGNVSTTIHHYTLDYSGDTTPPNVEVLWPTSETEISGDTFTLRGTVDDFTAKVTVTLNNYETTETYDAIVERNGKFWVEDMPLGDSG